MKARPGRWGVIGALIVVLTVFPWLPGVPFSLVVNANLAAEYTLIAFSLVLLTGWVGQISLGQGAFVGIGAFLTGILAREFGITFPLSLPFVALVTGGTAVLLGVVALRVRGLYLAVATLIFAWVADAYLFTSSWLVGRGGSSAISAQTVGDPETVTYFDLSDKKVLWIIMLAAVAMTWFAIVNLRDSKTGRAFFAVRGGEMAAASLGIPVHFYKLTAFAISGVIAGVAGSLVMIDLRAVTPFSFQFTVSLFYLSIAVVGGITSLGGAVAAGVLFAGLSEAFFRIKALNGLLDIVTVGLLLAVLLAYPGGLGALGLAAQRMGTSLATRVSLGSRLLTWWNGLTAKASRARRGSVRRDAPPAPTPLNGFAHLAQRFRFSGRAPSIPSRTLDRRRVMARVQANGASSDAVAPPHPTVTGDWRSRSTAAWRLEGSREDRPPVLEADNIVVRFGGLVAVNQVSLAVREQEIVGLIGPNGAGKTTTFNAIAGLNEPASGTIRLFGHDATALPVHLRARIGVGRTFQLIQLFPQLTVEENLLVATHVHNRSKLVDHLLVTDKAVASERDCRLWVREVLQLLGLTDIRHRRVAGLPFGVLRHVEIARALVTQSLLLMLDEPASGLDNAETDELAQLLFFLRAEVGVSILLIEHDVRMVTSVCDHIYVIDRGAPLANGSPGEIQRNPAVVAAYLGGAAESREEVVV